MKADELWEKYEAAERHDGNYPDDDSKQRFLAALHEYGQAVRARDAEICKAESAFLKSDGDGASNGCDLCAAAISREPLP